MKHECDPDGWVLSACLAPNHPEPALVAPTSGGDGVSAPGVQTQRGVGPCLRTSAWPGGWKNVARESPLWVPSFKNVQGAARKCREKCPPRERLCDRKPGMGGVCLERKKHQRLEERHGPLERPNSAATPASAFWPPEPRKSTFLLP